MIRRRIHRKTKEQLAFDKFVKGWKNWSVDRLKHNYATAQQLYIDIGFKDTIRGATMEAITNKMDGR